MSLEIFYLISPNYQGFQIKLTEDIDNWPRVSFNDSFSVPFLWPFHPSLLLFPHTNALRIFSSRFKRPCLQISRCISLCSSLLSVILSCELLTSLASKSPSSNFSTQGDHHAPLASPSLSRGVKIPPGSKLGQCRLTLFACPFSKFTVLHCQFSNVKSIVLYNVSYFLVV